MKAILKGATSYINGVKTVCDMLLDGADLSVFSGDISSVNYPVFHNLSVFPGVCDVHVHVREPGFSYKETIKSGTLAAAAGGYTAVCTMPNLNPVPDTVENIGVQLDIIKRDSRIAVYPYASITRGERGEELVDFKALSEYTAAFSDDGRGVQSADMMQQAMECAYREGKIIAAHCEDNSLLRAGYIHDGAYAKAHGHRGICSESEWGQIKRDIELAEKTGVKYHVCHISTKESVELIRRAKARGVNVTCETGPHYLILSDLDLEEDGRFKMNPPLRSPEDRAALIEGLRDGTIDMIATDHAPHSREEKARGLEGSLMGVVGLETAFSLLYTHLVMRGVITLDKLIELMCINPRRRFNITGDSGFAVFDLGKSHVIRPEEFLSKGRATPFAGDEVYAECLYTVYGGKVAFESEKMGGYKNG